MLHKLPIPGSIREIIEIYTDKKVGRSAAQLAYFFTLSLFPFIICLNAMLGSLEISEAEILNMGERIIPEGILTALGEYLQYIGNNSSDVMTVAGITLMATTSAAAFRAIMAIMEDIQGKSRFSGLFGALLSFMFSLVFLAAIYIVGILIVFGQWILNILDREFGIGAIVDVWKWLRFVILFFLLLFIIYALYRLSAPREKKPAPRILGAVTASFALVIVSMVFSWFIGMSFKYPLVYGSLASIIILMLWFNLCGNILIMGNVLNIVINKRRKEQKKEIEENTA